MTLMQNKIEKLLKNVPDFTSWKDARLWINQGLTNAQQMTPKLASETEFLALDLDDIEKERNFPFGLYASEKWRKFVLATFLADLVSYPTPIDQVNFDRLLYVMHAFPQGFRTWWMRLPDHSWWPAGYTGWYPMLETMYELFQKNPEKLKDRTVVPDATKRPNPYLYLFNYSLAPQLKKTALSKALMESYVNDISKQNAKGLACITVSEDGIRVAERLGMVCKGYLHLDGSTEGVYTKG